MIERSMVLETTLLELALACEFTLVLRCGSPRFRAALDAAFDLVDPDLIYRRAERWRQGCVCCGEEPEGDRGSEPPDLCTDCADGICEVCRQMPTIEEICP